MMQLLKNDSSDTKLHELIQKLKDSGFQVDAFKLLRIATIVSVQFSIACGTEVVKPI